MRSSFISIACSLLVLLSCAKHYPGNPLLYGGSSIVLGSGGGFTGFEKQYRLLDNGALYFRETRDSNFVMIGSKKKKYAKRWLAKFDSLATVDFNHPGNVYKYLEFKDGGRQKRIVWGSTAEKPDVRISDFYDRFMDYWVSEKKPLERTQK